MPYAQKELHGFTYLNANTVYAKNSDQENESYVIMTFDAMMDYYYTSRECKISATDSQNCFTETRYYKCSTLPNPLKQQMQAFHTIERLMNQLIFSEQTKYQYKDDCKSLSYQKRNEILYKMNGEIEKLKDSTVTDLTYAKIWVDVMLSQLFESEINARRFRCRKQMESTEKFKYYSQVKYAFKEFANFLDSQSSN